MEQTLIDRIAGAVSQPDDPGYGEEIAGFNTAIVHTPDLVVAAASTADIVEAVLYAREQGLRVSVQSTGHTDQAIISGLLITTRRLDRLSIDPATKVATIGAGVRWGRVVAEAAEHGLFPIAGSSPTVGAVGYLLGGGLGPLARSHGFSSDYLIGATVVTGTGDVVEAGPDDHEDLLWALRGGKTGLGIVTEVRVRLVELRSLYGGALWFAEEHIETALRRWIDWTANADPSVTTSVAIVRFPDLDLFPPPFRGRRLLSLRFAYPGPEDEGARLVEPLRAVAPVYLDGVRLLPTTDVAQIHGDPAEPGPSAIRGMLLARADQDLATVILGFVGAGTNEPIVALEVRQIGAAAERDVDGGSAAGGRTAGFTLSFLAAGPLAFDPGFPATARRLTEAVGAWLSPETNINFLGRPESAEELARAWPPDVLARLAEIRKRYDPDGVFEYVL